MDAARHPAEFLPFTQAKPGHAGARRGSTGGGYTSQLLALVVGPARDAVGAGAHSPARR